MGLKLYMLDTCPPVRAVLMTLRALNITDVELKLVNILEKEQFKPEYLKMNPQHSIPTLVDGDFAIWDSHAISCYLFNKYAPGHELYPTDPQRRAIIDQRLHFDSGVLFPTLVENARPIIYFYATSMKPESIEKVKSSYDLLESFLTKTWLAGDDLSLADISCVASVSTLTIFLEIDENQYPKLASWYKRCQQLDFYEANLEGLKNVRDLILSKLQ